jgi:7-carboxy-7-deazaguanine synthase
VNGELMKVFEIFNSIDGEVTKFHQGKLSTFIRLAGCNLDCIYCDTKTARKSIDGNEMKAIEIFNKIEDIGCNKITITGGEPLIQSTELCILLSLLEDKKYEISIETNGSINIPLGWGGVWNLNSNISWIMDYKLPSSNMHRKMDLNRFLKLSKNDWVKFVIKNRNDFNKAITARELIEKETNTNFAFSPLFGELEANILLDWLQETNQWNSIMSFQLHKSVGLK